MSIFFSGKRTKDENIRSPPFLYDTEMAADGYWARKALMLRELLQSIFYNVQNKVDNILLSANYEFLIPSTYTSQ